MTTTSNVRRPSRNAVRYKYYQNARRRRRQRFIGIAVALAALTVVLLLILNRTDSSDSVAAFELIRNPYGDISMSGRTLGDASAPVTVIEYGDYQCPGCGYFAREIEHQLVRDYIATGKVQFEYRDYAFIGEESNAAAQAAACALDQDAFWPYHATLFHSQLGENEGGFEAKRLKAMAHDLGLNDDQFSTCLDDDAHADDVAEMREEARSWGVTGTPSFIVNVELIDYTGYDALRAAIDAALAEKS